MSRLHDQGADGWLESQTLPHAAGVHPAAGEYVRLFYMADLGPTATALLQLLGGRRDTVIVRWDMRDLAARLGVGNKGGERSPLNRAIDRLENFQLASWTEDDVLLVPRDVPTLHERRVRKMPVPLQAEHETWLATHS